MNYMNSWLAFWLWHPAFNQRSYSFTAIEAIEAIWSYRIVASTARDPGVRCTQVRWGRGTCRSTRRPLSLCPMFIPLPAGWLRTRDVPVYTTAAVLVPLVYSSSHRLAEDEGRAGLHDGRCPGAPCLFLFPQTGWGRGTCRSTRRALSWCS